MTVMLYWGNVPPNFFTMLPSELVINDMVFTVGSIIFTLGLLPTLRHVYYGKIGKEITWTAVITASVLSVYCVNYWLIGCYITAIPHTCTVWWLIAYYSYRNSKISS